MSDIMRLGSSVKITMKFVDLIKKLGYVRNEDHDKVLETGLVEMPPLNNLSETHDILAIYGDNVLSVGPNSDKIDYEEFKPVRMYSDEDRIYVLFKSDSGKTISALYLDSL